MYRAAGTSGKRHRRAVRQTRRRFLRHRRTTTTTTADSGDKHSRKQAAADCGSVSCRLADRSIFLRLFYAQVDGVIVVHVCRRGGDTWLACEEGKTVVASRKPRASVCVCVCARALSQLPLSDCKSVTACHSPRRFVKHSSLVFILNLYIRDQASPSTSRLCC